MRDFRDMIYDVLVFGHDQDSFKEHLLKQKIHSDTCKVVAIPAFHPEKYSTKILRVRKIFFSSLKN